MSKAWLPVLVWSEWGMVPRPYRQEAEDFFEKHHPDPRYFNEIGYAVWLVGPRPPIIPPLTVPLNELKVCPTCGGTMVHELIPTTTQTGLAVRCTGEHDPELVFIGYHTDSGGESTLGRYLGCEVFSRLYRNHRDTGDN